MKTARGVYLNIEESTYFLVIDDFKLYFSSLFYLKKYKEMIEEYIKHRNAVLSSICNAKIEARKLLILELYKKIEKRGFLVYYKYERLNDNKFTFKLVME